MLVKWLENSNNKIEKKKKIVHVAPHSVNIEICIFMHKYLLVLLYEFDTVLIFYYVSWK